MLFLKMVAQGGGMVKRNIFFKLLQMLVHLLWRTYRIFPEFAKADA